MNKQKILFIDRDGTLIKEPADQQIDSMEKFSLLPGLISALLTLKKAGYVFVMVTNQDGLGKPWYPYEAFEQIQTFLLELLNSQGIEFQTIRICPHMASENCYCRKPKTSLVMDYLTQQTIDLNHSYVIGDRDSDLEFAKNLNITGIKIAPHQTWTHIPKIILDKPRAFSLTRKTNETCIEVSVNLNTPSNLSIQTGIGFFDHMLEQLAKHGGFGLEVKAHGDLHIDEHHTVEDIGITLGQALLKALGDKRGIHRYGFLLPMDEALSTIALDLSGRPFFVFEGKFPRECINNFPTELVPHFFRSFAMELQSSLHIKVEGDNAHHMVESIFKGVGRTLRQAVAQQGQEIPSTKGVL